MYVCKQEALYSLYSLTFTYVVAILSETQAISALSLKLFRRDNVQSCT